MKTIKTFLLIAATLAVVTSLNAQGNKKKNNSSPAESGDNCFNESTRIINLGVGLGGINHYAVFSGFGYNYKVSPAFSISYEQAYPKKLGPGYLGVGGFFGFQNTSSTKNYHWDKNGYNSNYYDKRNWTNYMIAARGAYHWDVLNSEKAELYAGTLVGLRIETYNRTTNNPDPSHTDNYSSGSISPTFSAFVGGRWYFAKNVGLFGEFGYGISYLTGGFSFKF